MAGEKATPGKLGEHISDALSLYSSRLSQAVQSIAEDEIKKANRSIKAAAPVGARGQYKRKMRTSLLESAHGGKSAVWHVAPPDYRLTHLLEHGHEKVNGGRTRAIPHIKKHEEEAVKNFERRVKEAIENESSRD